MQTPSVSTKKRKKESKDDTQPAKLNPVDGPLKETQNGNDGDDDIEALMLKYAVAAPMPSEADIFPSSDDFEHAVDGPPDEDMEHL